MTKNNIEYSHLQFIYNNQVLRKISSQSSQLNKYSNLNIIRNLYRFKNFDKFYPNISLLAVYFILCTSFHKSYFANIFQRSARMTHKYMF